MTFTRCELAGSPRSSESKAKALLLQNRKTRHRRTDTVTPAGRLGEVIHWQLWRIQEFSTVCLRFLYRVRDGIDGWDQLVGVSLRIGDRFKTALGTVSCVALAAAISLMGQTKPGKSLLPIWFLAVIMVIVLRFGTHAGIWGTLLSGLIFAAYLFEPIGSLAINNQEQKEHLMWMVLLGLAISIFGHSPDKPRRSSEM